MRERIFEDCERDVASDEEMASILAEIKQTRVHRPARPKVRT